MALILYMELEFYTPFAHSLKEKRSFIKSLKDKLKNRFNVAVAEIDYIDSWQKSLIGVVSISNSRQVLDKLSLQILSYIENYFPGTLLNYYIDIS